MQPPFDARNDKSLESKDLLCGQWRGNDIVFGILLVDQSRDPIHLVLSHMEDSSFWIEWNNEYLIDDNTRRDFVCCGATVLGLDWFGCNGNNNRRTDLDLVGARAGTRPLGIKESLSLIRNQPECNVIATHIRCWRTSTERSDSDYQANNVLWDLLSILVIRLFGCLDDIICHSSSWNTNFTCKIRRLREASSWPPSFIKRI